MILHDSKASTFSIFKIRRIKIQGGLLAGGGALLRCQPQQPLGCIDDPHRGTKFHQAGLIRRASAQLTGEKSSATVPD